MVKFTLIYTMKEKDPIERKCYVLNKNLVRSKKVWDHKLSKLGGSNIKSSAKVIKKTIPCLTAAQKNRKNH